MILKTKNNKSLEGGTKITKKLFQNLFYGTGYFKTNWWSNIVVFYVRSLNILYRIFLYYALCKCNSILFFKRYVAFYLS